jgi:hypothetical protein
MADPIYSTPAPLVDEQVQEMAAAKGVCEGCGYYAGSFACRIRHIHLNTGDAKASKDSG